MTRTAPLPPPAEPLYPDPRPAGRYHGMPPLDLWRAWDRIYAAWLDEREAYEAARDAHAREGAALRATDATAARRVADADLKVARDARHRAERAAVDLYRSTVAKRKADDLVRARMAGAKAENARLRREAGAA